MDLVAVGVPRTSSLAGGWDWWSLLAVLAVAVVLLRRNTRRGWVHILVTALVGGCAFGFAVDRWGVTPALAIASIVWAVTAFRRPGTGRPAAPPGV